MELLHYVRTKSIQSRTRVRLEGSLACVFLAFEQFLELSILDPVNVNNISMGRSFSQEF